MIFDEGINIRDYESREEMQTEFRGQYEAFQREMDMIAAQDAT